MKRFPFKKVLDGLTSGSSNSSPKGETEIAETLSCEHFTVCKVVRHGFPYEPTSMAYDPVQNILAVGTKNGSLRIFGRPGVDCHVRHDSDTAVLQLMFLVNEGALVSVCADDSLHLWNLRQKRPAILHSLKFNRERITHCTLPFQSKWLYIGTERGNVHVVNIESFVLSGYVINWNKAIELSRKTHPGPVVHLSDNPTDANKLLIGFETGVVAMWDLRTRAAEQRFNCSQPVRCISWHHEGKQFIVSHTDGTLTTWSVKNATKPANIISPHAKVPAKGLKPEPCTPVLKVEWRSVKNGDPFILFSGGLPYEKASSTPSITIMQGKTTTVLEMEHTVVDFLCLCDNPWPSNPQEPYAVVVLLESDLVVVDLTSQGYPCFENPYPMDLHESPVTCVQYYSDCPSDLIPHLYSAGSNSLNRKKQLYSKKNWPVKGGGWGSVLLRCESTLLYTCIVLIVCRHADGTVKFWDSSQVMLQVLYKLKTAKVFEKQKQARSLDGDEEPFAIQMVKLCQESRLLAVAGASGHVILYRFSRLEVTTELTVLEIAIVYEPEEPDTPEAETPPPPPPTPLKRNTSTISASSIASAVSSQQAAPTSQAAGASGGATAAAGGGGSGGTGAQATSTSSGEGIRDNVPNLKVKGGPHKRAAGFQPDLCCQLVWVDGEAPSTITTVEINSCYGLLAFGTTTGLVIVDFLQKTCLLNMGTPDLYGSADPYTRTPRSPKKTKPQGLGDIVEQYMADPERCKSPTGSSTEQQNGVCVSPTSSNSTRKQGRNNHDPAQLKRSKSQGSRKLISCKAQSVCSDSGNCGPGEAAPNGSPPTPPPSPKEGPKESNPAHSHFSQLIKFVVAGLSMNPSVLHVPYRSEGSFTRSRSSSMSSLEKEAREGVQCLTFAESYTRKTESVTSPCIWVGTTLGSVLVIVINLPPWGEQRYTQPVIVTPSGTILRLKGSTLLMAFLDCNGSLITPPYEPWKDVSRETKDSRDKRPPSLQRMRMSPSSSTEIADRQFVVICSEKEAKVISLPSQTCAYRVKVAESSYVVRADVISLQNSVCLACYVANGHIMAFSLPSFRVLLDHDYLPLTDLRIGRTFQFSSHGKGIYQASPTELQRITICSEASENLHDMLGDLFLPVNTPEAPSKGFFKGLFGGGSSTLDREDLFGESSGKPSRSIARHIPGTGGIEGVKANSSSAAGELYKARIALHERGEKLSELEERTAQMMASAENFSQASHQLMQKYKDKKWYQF
ncbi:syntaxin-binding protein 5-like [Acanthaster planci]|uniref:Syntaxin-binding protein 5-like n=1 Tax=Acanthaster planci TaxID=133434 RepID=A0A8B7Z477_ACAPL|nr:syntaxin-binding protein 5-like [Acanthaster planci]